MSKNTTVVVTFPEKVEGLGDETDAILCGGLYK